MGTALAILALTLTLSLTRLRIGTFRFNHASAAVFGALLSMIFGTVSMQDVAATLSMLATPLLTIVSLMLITALCERAGLLDWLSDRILVAANGNGVRLFLLIFTAGSITGAVFTNDAAILIMTPLVFAMVERIAPSDWTLREKQPFYFSVLYVGNVAAVLVISNPINIIVADYFGIGFVEYALWMALPALTSIVISYLGLRVVFRADLPRTFPVPETSVGIRPHQRRPVLACSAVLALTLAGFFLQGLTGVPTVAVAVIGASALLVMAFARREPLLPAFRQVGWDVLIFLVGIFIVAAGVRNAGGTAALGEIILAMAERMGLESLMVATALIAAFCSALINNHPTAGLMIGVVEDFGLAEMQRELLIYAALIGGDLGPKMLPIGSLAALMWFRILQDRGVEISYLRYIAIGIPVTLAAILLAVLVLIAQAILIGVPLPAV